MDRFIQKCNRLEVKKSYIKRNKIISKNTFQWIFLCNYVKNIIWTIDLLKIMPF